MSTETPCSTGSAAVGEQLAGSAPLAVAWVALEQNGPWGPKAFTDSHLDPDVGRKLEALAAEHQVRPCLIRSPGRHADKPTAGPHPRRVLVAFTRPGATWLLHGLVDDPADVLGLDWPGLQEGDLERVRRSLPTLEPTRQAHLLVCTNGTRDVCCATKGRPVAQGVCEAFPDRVWEVTHTSGHRFAPTAALLPAGTLHGRLAVADAVELVHAADRGETVLAGSRGRSTWHPPAQVAELAVRETTGELSLDVLHVSGHEATGEHAWVTDIGHVDGRTWRVVTESRESDVQRAESCGKALKPLTYFTTLLPR